MILLLQVKLVTGPNPTKGGSHYGIVDLDPVLESSSNFMKYNNGIYSSTLTFLSTVCVALLCIAALVFVYTKYDMRLVDRSSSAFTHEYTPVA